MNIYPAIDLYDGKVVRLLKGEYDKMTVYSDDPVKTAKEFAAKGATYLHMVDLEGAKSGTSPNLEVIRKICQSTDLLIQVGGGIRSMDTAQSYLSMGVNRIILGTAAITDRDFLCEALERFGEKIAVGVDVRDGKVAINGWTELSELSCMDFCKELEGMNVKTIICTDISKDGAMSGSNTGLYAELSAHCKMNIIASGGVSSLEEIKKLAAANLHGAILGKALYVGAVDLKEAIAASGTKGATGL